MQKEHRFKNSSSSSSEKGYIVVPIKSNQKPRFFHPHQSNLGPRESKGLDRYKQTCSARKTDVTNPSALKKRKSKKKKKERKKRKEKNRRRKKKNG